MNQKRSNPVTVNVLIDEGARTLRACGKQDAAIDAELLALHILGYTKLDRILNGNTPIAPCHMEQYRSLIHQRCSGIPLQYITHEQEFMGLPFYVDQNVLIPRQDTETLIEVLIEKSKETPFHRIIEVGVGSGCISISLAKFLPYAHIVGIDISKEALTIAQKNAQRNDVADRIMWMNSDLFNEYDGEKNSIDLIVSNPPYISTSDCQELMEEVKEHEPMLALDGGNDGLYFYREITLQAKQYLRKNGMLAYEIGYDQGQEVKNILDQNGFIHIEVIQDLTGKDRVVIGRL